MEDNVLKDALGTPLYARVGRQLEGPLHGTLVPLQHESTPAGPVQRDVQCLRRRTIAMAALAVLGVVALGAQLVRAAGRAAPPAQMSQATQAQNVGAGLATAARALPGASSSPAADAARP